MIIDSHAHLTSSEITGDIDEIIAHALQENVSKIVNICTDSPSLHKGLLLAKKYPNVVYNTAATTPHDVDKEGALFFPEVETHRSSLIAIGETGLDFHYEHSPREIQEEFLLRYFALATKTKLPLIFHCRDAFSRLFELAKQHYQGPALVHCFTGTLEEAKQVIDLGWYLSLSGILTFKKSEELRKVASSLPLDRILIETDAPFLAPQSKRGKQNEPAFITETARCLASITGKSFQEICEITAQNGEKFFSFSKVSRDV